MIDSARARHLLRRFAATLTRRRIDPDEEEWAIAFLGVRERGLWAQMSEVDRRHSADVARELRRSDPDADAVWVTAALLHDVGKSAAGAGVMLRVAATLVERWAQHAVVVGWLDQPGVRGRLARQLHYEDLGAQMLTQAHSDRRVVAWAREHHRAPDEWSVDPIMGERLAAADRQAQ